MNSIEMKFCPMPAIPKGDYEAEASLVFKRNMLKDKEAIKNYKQGTFSSKVEPIVVNVNQKTLLGKLRLLLAQLGSMRSGLKLASDPTYDLALYNLVEKYPNIDYWTNIRVERESRGRKSAIISLVNMLTGSNTNPYIKTGKETVKVVATGVDVLTDSEYEAFKKTPEFDAMKEILFPVGTPAKNRK